VVHPPVQVQQFGAAGVRLRRLGQLPSRRRARATCLPTSGVTKDLLTAFQVRRLEALEHVGNSIQGNPNTQKTPFVLPDLAHYEDKAHDLAHALHEFVTIERLVALNDWKATRHAPPERRVLMGEALLVRYVEADQEPGVAEQNRENERRRRKREEYAAAFKAANPDKQFRLKGEQSAECKWSPEGLRLRLRVECEEVDCDLNEALLMSTLRDGDRLVLFPRWTVDERLPVAERKEFTPTPKQMLYGPRAELLRIVATKKDEAGRVTEAFAEVELKESVAVRLPSRLSSGLQPHAGGRQALHPRLLPERVVRLLVCAGGQRPLLWLANVLYDRLVTPPPPGDGSGSPGQKAFLAGLDAFREVGLLHDFEAGKREFIGSHARTPVLLVQGPPGTGKSYSTAFAVFARLQGRCRKSVRTGSFSRARRTPPRTF